MLATAGAVALLYVGYSLYWTTAEANGAARQQVASLRQEWQRERPAAQSPDAPAGGKGSVPRRGAAAPPPDKAPSPGSAFALLRIPRLGADWISPVIEGHARGDVGVDPEDLDRGVVHYPLTAAPGRVGNFSVAGHRATHGEPFKYLDRLRPGDELTVETRRKVFTYVVTGSAVVAPTQVDVIAPVPRFPGKQADKARMTLTTCHPRWSSTSRLIVWAQLASDRETVSTPV